MERNLWRNLPLVFLIVVFTFVEGEAGARYLQVDPDPIITLDSCTGYKPKAAIHGYSAGPLGLIPIETNSLGFRDVEHANEKPDGVYRVLFLGDSFTEALQVPEDKTFTRRLQKMADDKHEPLEIITMAVSSFGTGQELLAYECYGKAFHPDLVVLDFNSYDLLDNSFRIDQFTPGFSIIDGKLTEDETFRRNIQNRLAARATLFPGSLYFMKDHSMLLRYLVFKIQNAQAGKALSDAAGVSSPALPLFAKEYPPAWEEAWNLTEKIIAKLNLEVHTDKASLLLLNLPPQEQLDAPSAVKDSSVDFSKPSQRLGQIGKLLHVPVLDLYKPLSSAGKNGPVHFNNDPHLTALGHEVVAEALFKELQSVYVH